MQSSKMAAVGQLAGGVAHGLNTPLGAVALAIEAADESGNQAGPSHSATAARHQSGRSDEGNRIQTAFLLARRRTGWRETSVNQVIEDTLQMVGHQLRLDNVEVLQQLGRDSPILANANELQRGVDQPDPQRPRRHVVARGSGSSDSAFHRLLGRASG